MNPLAYFNLTKPRISLLFAFTGLIVLLMDLSMRQDPFRLWILVLAIFLVGGAANALNQYFERDRDIQMKRTASKRPLPLGLISPRQALIFSIVIGVLGNFFLYYWGGWLAALFGVGTILFYSFYYTLWLKPRTPYNIVIGGIAGAMGPLIAGAALSTHLFWIPFLLFLIIFFWTPPHFWALALVCKEDYAKVGLPMLPVAKGEEETRKQIFYYSLTLLPLSLLPYFLGAFGMLYGVSAGVLSLLFIIGAYRIYSRHNNRFCWPFFAYSILYLILIFSAMLLDLIL